MKWQKRKNVLDERRGILLFLNWWKNSKLFKRYQKLVEKEEIISVLIKDLEEQIGLIDLYEQEIVRIESELRITNLILESLNLYGNKGE